LRLYRMNRKAGAMSKVLVVVYSWTGTSHRLAEAMSMSRQWAMAEIRDAKPGRTAGRCVIDSLLRRRPAIRYEGPDPLGFDAVVLISPIWVGRLAAPMRSFIADRAKSLPPAVVVSVMGGRGAPGALAEVSRLLRRAPTLDTAFTQREVEDGSSGARVEAFGKAVDEALGRSAVVLRPAFGAGT
jgi:hypothetical protein